MDLTPLPLRNNSIYALTTSRQKLAHKYTLADGPPTPKESRDALNNSPPTLAENCTLAPPHHHYHHIYQTKT